MFAGWGGMTLGAKLAGAEVVHAENHWERGIYVHQVNHPEVQHAIEDVRGRDWRSLPYFQLLTAGPACQGHSSNGRAARKRNPMVRELHDVQRATANAVVECVEATEPEALVVENVPPFLDWEGLQEWWARLERAGLHLQLFKLWASHYDVPQRRQRVFIVGTRKRVKLGLVERPLRSFPEPAFGPCIDWSAPGWRPISSTSPQAQARMARAKQNHGPICLSQHVTDHPGVSVREPIRTITTAANHWVLVRGDECRFLTARELARAQGFPETHRIRWEAVTGQVWHGQLQSEEEALEQLERVVQEKETMRYFSRISVVPGEDHDGPKCCSSGEKGAVAAMLVLDRMFLQVDARFDFPVVHGDSLQAELEDVLARCVNLPATRALREKVEHEIRAVLEDFLRRGGGQ
jgi:DNA (cytosine-5)-methyltransferase 1